MKATLTLGLALVLAGATAAIAAELKSGLQPGDLVPAFDVEKCGGAVNDGKEVGDNFCYRCMLGNKPVVMVFARKADKSLATLVKELDKTVAKNSDQKLSSFVNLIGSDPSELKAKAKEFAAKNQVENVALVVPHDNENGPAEFNISPAADVTVTIYRNGKVVASHAVSAGDLNKSEIESIIADTGKILK
ncbi:MAG TPA: hypothetical protein VHV08_06630 [Pirellulales bacterium]|jgi:hypothetical protein|nr:hypothetical protein [Pirellulales bacterium]